MTFDHDFPSTYLNQSLLAHKSLQKSIILGKYYMKAIEEDDKIIKRKEQIVKKE